jgi:hypothetical protein
MKKLYTLFFIVFFANNLLAQNYGNEWIDYSQKYYRIKIYSDGVYRIDSSALAASGINLSGLNPQWFQLFGRGAEQAIFINGEADGIFNTSDFIEFYGRKNDGYFDQQLYDTAANPNPYYSLITDTATYFLTWKPNTSNNLRLQVISDTTFSQYTPVNYFFKEDVIIRPNDFFGGNTLTVGATEPQYTQGEGWFDYAFTKGNSPLPFIFNTSNVFSGGPLSVIKFTAVGASNEFNTLAKDHELLAEYNNINNVFNVIADTLFDGYKQVVINFQLASNQLGANTTVRFTSVNNPNFSWGNRTAIAHVSLKFPHNLNLENTSAYKLFLPDNTQQTKSFLNFSNFSSSNTQIYLYDITNAKRYIVTSANGNQKVLVQNTNNEKECYVFASSQIQTISSLTPVTSNAQFTQFSPSDFDSAYLIITHNSLMNGAQQYENYRQSLAGGSHNVLVADVNELYDQYANGIENHPLGVKNFLRFGIDTADVVPRYLFLLGKSIVYIESRKASYNSSFQSNFNKTLVPCIGYPAVDNMFTAGLIGTMLQPFIPTGRLAANTNQEVIDYLNKIILHESNTPGAWMKHVLHFGGGSNTFEQNAIQQYLTNYENVIESPLFGGSVHTFLKTTSQPIQLTISDSVKALVNNGVSLMTFFGHASGNSFDQNLDLPQNYNNYGKYPVLLANACFTGDIHQPVGLAQSSASEEWVLVPNKGVVAFVATVSKSVMFALNLFSAGFYNNLSGTHYNKSLAENIKQSITTYQNPLDPILNAVLFEFTLHGDPALKLNNHLLPDYSIADSSIYFSPQIVTTAIDSFGMNVVITNIGKATNDTVLVEVKRIFPDGSSVIKTKQLTAIYYRDTVAFTFEVDKIKGPGLNKFEVRVDPLYAINELSENNNNVVFPPALLLISSGDINPIYPYKYAIIPNDTVTLKASTGDPFAKTAKYRFEIDTTDLFTTVLSSTQLIAPGGVLKWQVPLTLTDSTVYFWRIRRDTTDTTNYRWKEFSFQYIKNKRGWEQAHFFQFKNDDFSFLNHNRTTRTFDFVQTGKTLICNDYGQRPPNLNTTQLYGTEYKLDLDIIEYAGCGGAPAMHIAVIDPITLLPWGKHWIDNSQQPPVEYNTNHDYGNQNNLSNCRDRMERYFIFRYSDAAQMQGMKQMLMDSVPNGHYVLAYTWINGSFRSWADTTAKTAFDLLGSQYIHTMPDSIPYIFFCKKGDTSSVIELVGQSATDFLQLQTVLTNNAYVGTINSEIIGPAISWDSLSWYQKSFENPSQDSVALNIIGINNAGQEVVLRQGLPIDSANIYISNINAANYPFLKLNLFVEDDSLNTAAQLKKWQVFYQPAPELSVNPPVLFSFYSDTLQEGDSLRFKVAVTNVSEFYMDSTLVTFWIIDRNRALQPVSSYMAKPLMPDSSLITSVNFATNGLPGINSVWMEINPINRPQTKYEQYHFNNIAQLGFFVGVDKTNPLLDVTFDGVHILNGDIVSGKPSILVKLKDENMFLALNDTADFAVYVKSPSQQTAQRIYFSSIMIFEQANLPNNSCKINYTPTLLEDGIYEFIVQAKDRSANNSGAIDYKITFEVINKPSVTEVLNYPNPFSTSTRFVFTLTGNEVPDYFKIQIFTITGKLIKEISKDELGNIHIGRNITDYAWDGTDMFGDKLANGIYLYRVQTQLNGSEMEKRESGADSYFKKGFGKMYLMR